VLGDPVPILLVVRVESVGEPPLGAIRLDGDLVSVVALPDLPFSPRFFVDALAAIRLLWHTELGGAPVLQMPGVVSSLVLLVRLARRRPFVVNVVGDPIDVAFKGGVGGLPGRLAGVGLWATTRLACHRAAGCSYVTEAYLQRRYPPGPGVPSIPVSNVQLANHPLVDRPVESPVRRLVTVGSLAQGYKRADLLLEALAVLRREGWDVDLDIVGGGRLLPDLESQARVLGVDEHVRFHGHLDTDEVHAVLGSSDLFVLCSDTEGLPRALLEAMATGLPCIGSSVGGIPELLPAEARFEAGSLTSLVGALRRFLVSPSLRVRAREANVARSGDFSSARLLEARRRWRDLILAAAR
jgi:glycosyltransferase involved in cell wall biosynthesis